MVKTDAQKTLRKKSVVKPKIEVTAKNLNEVPPGRYSLGGGLTLLVSSPTQRSWIYRYQMNGTRRDFSIGSANRISITLAKSKAKELSVMVADGIDPRDDRRMKAALSIDDWEGVLFRQFAEVAIDEIESVKRWKNPKHAAQWRSSIRTYAYPVLGDMPIEKIERDDVLAVLKDIWTEKPETANRVRGRLEEIFSLAIARRLIKENPAAWKDGLAFFLPSLYKVKEEKHHAAMPLDKTKDFTKAMLERHTRSSLAIAFGILTATRVGEFLGARWDEIDWKTNTWSIPAERMKNGQPHRVPLSRQALKILEWQRISVSEKLELVFPSKKDPKKPLSIDTPRVIIQKAAGEYTMHGFRSTFRDWCEESFVHPSLSERALSHNKRDKLIAAYQRSDLLEQRRPVMQQWADALLPNL